MSRRTFHRAILHTESRPICVREPVSQLAFLDASRLRVTTPPLGDGRSSSARYSFARRVALRDLRRQRVDPLELPLDVASFNRLGRLSGSPFRPSADQRFAHPARCFSLARFQGVRTSVAGSLAPLSAFSLRHGLPRPRCDRGQPQRPRAHATRTVPTEPGARTARERSPRSRRPMM